MWCFPQLTKEHSLLKDNSVGKGGRGARKGKRQTKEIGKLLKEKTKTERRIDWLSWAAIRLIELDKNSCLFHFRRYFFLMKYTILLHWLRAPSLLKASPTVFGPGTAPLFQSSCFCPNKTNAVNKSRWVCLMSRSESSEGCYCLHGCDEWLQGRLNQTT